MIQLFCAVIDLKKIFVLHSSQLGLPFRMARVGSQQVLQGEIITVIEDRINLVGKLEIFRRIDGEPQMAEVFLPVSDADLETAGHVVEVGHDVFSFKRLGSFPPGAFKRGK